MSNIIRGLFGTQYGSVATKPNHPLARQWTEDQAILARRQAHDEQYGEGTYDNRFAAENAYPELRGPDGVGGARLAAQRQLERQNQTAGLTAAHNARMDSLRGGQPAPRTGMDGPSPDARAARAEELRRIQGRQDGFAAQMGVPAGAPAQPPAAPPANPMDSLPNEYPNDPIYVEKRKQAAAIRDPAERDAVMRTAGKSAFDRKVAAETGYPDAASANYAGVDDHIKRKRWIEEMAVRHRADLAAGRITIDQLMAENPYGRGDESGVSKSGHTLKKPSDLMLMLGADGAARRRNNVSAARRQDDMAMHMGLTRGQVMQIQDVQASFDAGKPEEGYAKMAIYGMGGDHPKDGVGALAAKAEAEAAKKPEPKNAMDLAAVERARISQMKPGTDRLLAIRMLHTTAMGAQADPKAVDAAVQTHWQPHGQDIMRRGIANMTPEERVELQQGTAHLAGDYNGWRQYLGVSDSPETQTFYKQLTGKNATYAQYWSNVGATLNPFD